MSDDLGPKICGYVYGAFVESIPSQVECSIVGTLHRNGDAEGLKLGYFQMIYRLMLAGFCLLLTCSPVFGQFTVTERDSFTVTVRNQDETKAVSTHKRRWLAVFTTSYCGSCHQWRRTQRQIVRDAGVFVREHDMGTEENKRLYGATIQRVPAYIVCDWDTGEWLSEPIIGYTSAESLIETIETAARSQDTAKDSPASNDAHPVSVVRPFRNPSLFGSVGTSHESRSTLIRHLLNDGIHRGRWQIDTLNAMSDDALNQAHSDDHGSGR